MHVKDCIKLHRMTWYMSYVEKQAWTTIIQVCLWSKRFTFMFGLGSNGYFCDQHTIIGWGHGYGFASNVGYLRSDLVELLV
jgi:hypothetical protein